MREILASNIYRVNTHMASHWARIGMELYIITGKQKYKDVFDNISFGDDDWRAFQFKKSTKI